ncbi:MAG: hypothetical protein ABI655_01440, partial [Phenylobacterium sp.]
PPSVTSRLKIARAQYGRHPAAQGVIVDVTEQARNYYADPRHHDKGYVSMKVSPSTFGIPDPDPGAAKILILTMEPIDAGGATPFSMAGEDVLKIPLSALVGSDSFSFVSAVYANEYFSINFTNSLTEYFRNGLHGSSLVVGDQAFRDNFCGGKDPSPGHPKYCSFSYTRGVSGSTHYALCEDGETLQFL